MTFFSELFELTRDATVAMIVSGDHASGQMTVSVIPKPRERHQEDGLCRDLTLVGKPDEFEEQFLSAMREYRTARTSLVEQARTTVRVLEAATQASSAAANSKERTKHDAPRLELTEQPGQGDASKRAGTHQPDAVRTVEPAPQADLFE